MSHALHLITFLGRGRYQETTYTWQDRQHTTAFAPIATTAFLQPVRVSVFLTQEARTETFPQFRQAFQATFPDLLLRDVDIPSGKNEEELWFLFERLVDVILEAPERVIAFDITYSFRSLPVLALLAAAYAQAAFQIRIQAVLYGAWEARVDNTTPMFDLTPVLTLLEWAVAADRFNRTGDARYLASLLDQAQRHLARKFQNQPQAMEQWVRPVAFLRGTLTQISQSLAVTRPQEVRRWAHRLPQNLEAAKPGLTQALLARPFLHLLDAIDQSYRTLSPLHDPEDLGPYERLQAERALLQWYLEHEYWVQAITLGREWLVSWVMYHLDLNTFDVREDRQYVEGVLNPEADRWLEAKTRGQPFRSRFLRDVPHLDEVLALWKDLSKVRNDINHAGMRQEPGRAEDLVANIQKILRRLMQLPLEPKG